MDNDPSTRHILEGRELIDYLVEKASGATNTEMLQREERRNRRTTAMLSVLGFVGIGAIVGAIKMFVQQEISLSEQRVRQHVTQSLAEDFDQRGIAFERTITDSIAARVDDQVGAVRKELQNYKVYQELLAHTEVIASQAAEGKVADQALKLSLEAINKLAGVEAIKGQPRFLDAVNVVVDVLVRTDRKREINEVELLLNDVLGLQKDIALDLADHYGEIIVASPYAIEELGVESEALARYAAASREHKYPEKALMWELFVAYKANDFRPNRTTQGMVEMARDLNRQDLNEFCYQIVLHTNPYHWMGVPDHEGRELAKMTNQLLRDHAPLREMVQKQSSDEHLAPRLAKLAERRQRYTGHADETPVVPAAPAANVPESSPQVANHPAEAADNNALRR